MSSRLPWIDPLNQLQFCRFSTSSSPSESQWGSGCWCEHWRSPLSAYHSKSQNKTLDRLKNARKRVMLVLALRCRRTSNPTASRPSWRISSAERRWMSTMVKLMQSQRKSFNEYLVRTVRKRESEKGSTSGTVEHPSLFVRCWYRERYRDDTFSKR